MPEKEAKDEKLGSTEVSAANEKSAKSKKPKPTKKSSDESFNWTNGTSLEKAGFIGSMLFLVAAVVFLVFEFIRNRRMALHLVQYHHRLFFPLRDSHSFPPQKKPCHRQRRLWPYFHRHRCSQTLRSHVILPNSHKNHPHVEGVFI